jgi:hypothetical protein
MYSEWFITFGMFIVRCYVIFNMNVMKALYYLRENFPVFRRTTDSIQNVIHAVREYFCSHYIDPPYDYLSIVSTIGDDYNEILRKIECSEDPLTYFNRIIENMPQYNCQVSVSACGLYLTRVIMDERGDLHLTKTKTPKHFLSIEYSHPTMDDKVPIELNASVYMEGNEILTKQFVRRYLEYQAEPFVFDDNYKLILMDSKIKMLELNSEQYVSIGKTGYEIKSISI